MKKHEWRGGEMTSCWQSVCDERLKWPDEREVLRSHRWSWCTLIRPNF